MNLGVVSSCEISRDPPQEWGTRTMFPYQSHKKSPYLYMEIVWEEAYHQGGVPLLGVGSLESPLEFSGLAGCITTDLLGWAEVLKDSYECLFMVKSTREPGSSNSESKHIRF